MNYQQGNFNQGGFGGMFQNNMQGYNNPNYNMAQLAPNYGFNANNQPPVHFNPTNVNRKNLCYVRNNCKWAEICW